jgi:preprotein translocase subunit SecG
MKLKKSTLVLTGFFYTITVLLECNSSAGQEQANRGQITTIELRSYLARLRFPEDSTSLHTKNNATDTTLIFSHDGDIRAELTERSE